MPLIISVMRKNVPALSNELSLLSSHRSLRGKRKPCGGGPAGVAARMAEDEKAAVAVGWKCRDVTVPASAVRGRARASAVRDLVGAMGVGRTVLAKWEEGRMIDTSRPRVDLTKMRSQRFSYFVR